MTRGKDSGWKIPSDWDGETLECIQLHWPASQQYRQLLVSLLYTLTRGREYDRHTGIIKDAQAAGWVIFDANVPLVLCGDGDGETLTVTEIQYRGAGMVVLEGDNMGQVVTDVTIEDGILYVYFGPCCKIEVGAIGAPQSGYDFPQPGDEGAPDPPTSESYTACSKAYAIWYVWRDIIDRILDGVRDTDWPLAVKAEIESAHGVQLGALDFANAYTAGVGVESQGFASETEETYRLQLALCQIAAEMEDDAFGIDEDTYQRVISAVLSTASQQFHVLNFPTGFGFMRNLWFWAMKCIGAGDARAITSYVPDNGVYDCECPGEPEPTYEWDIYYDFAADMHGTGGTAPGEGAYEPGVGYTSDDDDYVRFNTNALSEISGHLKRVRIEYSMSETDGSDTGAAVIFKRPGDDPELITYAEMRAGAVNGYIDKQVSVYYGVGASDTVRLMVQMREGGDTDPTITITGLRASGDGDACIPEATP